MAIEIERKFLVLNDSWKSEAESELVCKQGYLAADRDKTVRIRVMGEKAFLTIKGATYGLSRSEYEYEIPVIDAEGMLQFCANAPVEKVRYHVRYEGFLWEIDVFGGSNAGLVVAEIELESEHQEFKKPAWLGDEVSGDERFYNALLYQNPYSRWKTKI